jgi:hypothetical protein
VGASGFSDAAKSAAAGIRPESIASHIRFLADDLLAGRDPGTPGYDVAARYVASELQAMGLKPSGEAGTYFQKVPFVRGTPVSGSLEFTGGPGTPVRLITGENAFLLTDLDQGLTDVSAEAVFAGHGLSVPEYGYDDFASVDVRDKIAVVLAGAPRSDRKDFFPALASAVHGQSERVARELMRRGAKGLVWVWPPAKEALTPFKLLLGHYGFDAMRLEDSPPLLPEAMVDASTFQASAEASRPDGDRRAAGRGLGTGKAAQLLARAARPHPPGEQDPAHHLRERRRAAPRRPGLPHRKEMVMYGAHLDHMGVGKPVNGDSIYNGASDDAAGVASILEIARAFTRIGQPLRRGILVLFVTAEERGLLGSEWFARHPTVPLQDVVADIDVDGAYPISPLKDVVALGTDESSLGGDVARAAAVLGIQVSPDPEPEEAYFVRSDNFNFVKKGIPAAQTFNGVAGLDQKELAAYRDFWRKRYHQPQDNYEPDRDWEPLAQLTRFNFLLGVAVVQAPSRPTWNTGSWFRRFPEPTRAGEPE